MFLQSYSVVSQEIMSRDIYICKKDSDFKKIYNYLLNNIKKEVLVVEDERLIGLVTIEDINRLEAESVSEIRLEDIMVKSILTLNGQEAISDVRLLMKEKSIGRLPILIEGSLAGIIREENIRDYFYRGIDEGEEAIMNVFDSINEAVCVVDKTGRVIVWNKNAEKLYNITGETLKGQYLKDYFPNAIDLEVFKSKKKVTNIYHSPKEGYHVIISASPIMIGGNLYGVVSTEKGLAEVSDLQEELDKANERLDLLEKEMNIINDDPFDKILGHSKKIISRIEIAKQIAPTTASVLISGESGTGKEEFAKAIHRYSEVEGEFIPVNCAAIPSELFESEFFGYEGGAFTGARSEGKLGFFEQAKNGTLFLDEIGDMPLPMQVKLLRVLQDKKVKRVGGEKFNPIDVRILSASNLDLLKMIEEGRFREELYYRINVVEIDIPALRERKEDIGIFIDYFIKVTALENNKLISSIDSDVVDYLIDYPWSGNIRQLKNVIEHMVIMCRTDTIDMSLIPKFIKEDSLVFDKLSLMESGMDLNNLLENFEQELIINALEKSKGNIREAAEILNIPRTTLHSKIRKYRIKDYI